MAYHVRNTRNRLNVKELLMPLPTFLIIGAMKSGTTTLYNLLTQHPQIFMSPVKEPTFFIRNELKELRMKHKMFTAMTIDDYQQLFQGANGAIAIGEASPGYMSNPESVSLIKEQLPNSLLIAILRNPVHRAYSHYNHARNRGLGYGSDFETAIEAEIDRPSTIDRCSPDVWTRFVRLGDYYSQLKPYFDTFDRSQLHVCLLEDLISDPAEVVQKIFAFLGTDSTFVPDYSARSEEGKIPKSRILDTVHSGIRRMPALKAVIDVVGLGKTVRTISTNLRNTNQIKPGPMSEVARARLAEYYRPGILKLEKLLERNLSVWLEQ
jgi:hypothetical protein